MMSSELATMDLSTVGDLIRAGKASSREVTEDCLKRIEVWQPRINAFIAVEAEAALTAARAADEAQANGRKLGTLHGIPLAHKDMYYRKGQRCTCGSKIRRDFVPDHDSTALQRLARAGALHLGPLCMSEFAFSPTGHNVHFGDTCNPWNPAHITGGSSSGSGAATAARLVYGALGSDTGGSIRLPAAFCGVSGVKPTWGRVSRYGAMGLSHSLDTVGPLAPSVRDCARIMQVIAGPDDNDPTASRTPIPDYEAMLDGSVKGLRVGLPKDYYLDDVSAEMRAALQAAADMLRGLGASVVEVAIPDADLVGALGALVIGVEAATIHGPWMRTRPQDYSAQLSARLRSGYAIPATRYLEALNLRGPLLTRFTEAVFGKIDLLLAPAFSSAAPGRAETDVRDGPEMLPTLGRLTRLTRPANYLGLPAVSIPAGFGATGLPLGVQMIGRPFDEATLLRAGDAYQRVTDWHRRVPTKP
jgi:aspartyl-tRNA(Asn)/glutamyl-tRNA(Gln) amidotransferase subunit A